MIQSKQENSFSVIEQERRFLQKRPFCKSWLSSIQQSLGLLVVSSQYNLTSYFT